MSVYYVWELTDSEIAGIVWLLKNANPQPKMKNLSRARWMRKRRDTVRKFEL